MLKKRYRILPILLTMVLLLSVLVAPAAAKQGNTTFTQPNVSLETEALIGDLLSFAENFVSRRAVEMVGIEDMPLKSVRRLDNGVAYESMAVFSAEQVALAELNARHRVLRDWGEAYTSSFTKLALLHADIMSDIATLDVEEFSKLYYAKIRGDEPDFTAWVVQRRFVFVNGEAGWELVSQQLLNNNGQAPVNEPTGATEDTMRKTLAAIASTQREGNKDIEARNSDLDGLSSTHSVGIQSTFNRAAARDYAIRFWQTPNPAYRSFSADCTNFISQAMRAGGWTDVPGWYRDTRHWWYNWLNQTWSWVGVRHWFEFAFTHSRRTTLLSQPRALWEGEVLQVDFENNGSMDHTMIVTRKTASEIYLTYRTVNTFERSFASLSLAFPNARWFPHMVFSQF
ncbi:MAG: hypothetical protein DDT32_01051 [Syntrophomonadaceae bacterium]|nr:hypothetical protein [Bacillota bacterium]